MDIGVKNHSRSHAVTDPNDHTATADRTLYSDGSGDIQELAHGTETQIYGANGTTSAPAWRDDDGVSPADLQTFIDNLPASGGIIRLAKGTYSSGSALSIPATSSKPITIEGRGDGAVIIQLDASSNVSVITNTALTSNLTLRNLVIDQQGSTQTTGGGMSFTGLQNSTFENVEVLNSQTFNMFVQRNSAGATALTGTLTFTKGDTVVVGVGTAFTTELVVGDIVRSAGGYFAEVISITDNTNLNLSYEWQHATESGVAATQEIQNSGNRIINCTFRGSTTTDNVGLGLFNRSEILGCISDDSGGGYGFGPDSCYDLNITDIQANTNNTDGIGLEACVRVNITNPHCNYNDSSANGIRVLSGSRDIKIVNPECIGNGGNGISITRNSSLFGPCEDIVVFGGNVSNNGEHGIRMGGVLRGLLTNVKTHNNSQDAGSHYGIAMTTDNTIVCDDVQLIGLDSGDTQDTATQVGGVLINTGQTDTKVVGGNFVGNTTYTVNDLGTGTLTSVFSPEIVVADLAPAAVVTESEGIIGNDNDTTIPTSAATLDLLNDNGWIQLDADVLGSAGDTLATSWTGSYRYIKFMWYAIASGGVNSRLTLNGDTATNYNTRTETNGGAHATSSGDAYMQLHPGSAGHFGTGLIINYSAAEKLLQSNVTTTTVSAVETWGEWTNTAAAFTSLDIDNSLAGSYAIGSSLSVWGAN